MNSRSTWNGPTFVQRRSSGGVRYQTHIEGRRIGALEHHTARLVARFKEGSHRDDGSVTGAGRRGADQETTHKA